MAERKDCHALISRFEKKCKDRGTHLSLNRYTERWAADALLESISKDDLNNAMDYYFQINREKGWIPDWQFFARNADKLLKAKHDADADEKARAEIRRKLKEVMNEH